MVRFFMVMLTLLAGINQGEINRVRVGPPATLTFDAARDTTRSHDPRQTTGDTQSETQSPAESPRATARGPALNVNTATAAELEELPGIGPSTAARIVEYRQKHGSFKKVEDLMNVRGIGEKSFLKLKPLITVTPMKADRGTGAPQG